MSILSLAAAGGPFPAGAQTGGRLVLPALVALSPSLCFVEVWSHLVVPQMPLGPGGAAQGLSYLGTATHSAGPVALSVIGSTLGWAGNCCPLSGELQALIFCLPQ